MKRLGWLFILPFFMLDGLKAQSDQTTQIDSLEKVLQTEGKDPLLYYELAQLYAGVDSNAALEHAHNGLQQAAKDQNQYGLAKGYFTLGNLHLDYNQSLVAENYYQVTDSILVELMNVDSSYQHLRLWVRNQFNTNVALGYRGINRDIAYLEKIRPIAEKIGAYDILAKANTNLAINFYNNGQYQKAHGYFLKSGDQHLRMGDYPTLAEDRLIFASCLVEMDSFDQALWVLNDVKAIIDDLDDPVKLQIYHTIMGEYQADIQNLSDALFHFKKAEKLLERNELIRNNLQLYMDMMQVYHQLEDYENALTYAHIALALTQKNKNKILEAEIYKDLAKYQAKMGNHQSASESLLKYAHIADSINIAEREKAATRLEAHYQSERKERQILQLQNENNQVALLLVQKRSQIYLLLLASLGLLCLAGFTYLGYRNFRKRDQLKTNEIERLHYEQEARVSNAMLEGQENERKRIAIDLHDGLAGRLSATRIKLEKLGRYGMEEESNQVIQEAALNIDESLSELRTIARNLMPETLFRYGLKNAIEDYCSSISSGHEELKFILQFYHTALEIPANMLLTIYRIMQELINNAVKHAKATEVLVQFLFENGKADITVEDNGVGFSPSDTEISDGMGLKNLRTRVAYLNGQIDFESHPGEGTTVHIVIDTKI